MYYLWITCFGIGFTFLMATLGAASVFCFKRQLSLRANTVLLGLSAGLMLAACIWSLLLPSAEYAEKNWQNFAFFPVVGGILLGCLFIFLMDKCFRDKGGGMETRRTRRLFLAVTLHNIPEGLAVGFAFGGAWATGEISAFLAALSLAIGIGVQNFPEGAALSLPLYSATKSRKRAFLYSFYSNLVEPIFAMLGVFLSAYLAEAQAWLLAFAAGAMLFVVCEELIPATLLDVNAEDKERSLGIWCIILGFCGMLLLEIFLV
ncbi:MAG: ZIP family metal transporter [Clostridiales bacterium]|nr:ZIP family metal transporter [Clostridiales bacterium]